MILEALGIHLHFSWLTAAPYTVSDARISAMVSAAHTSSHTMGRPTPFSAEGVDGTVRPLADNVRMGKIHGTSYEVRMTNGAIGTFVISPYLMMRIHQLSRSTDRAANSRGSRTETDYVN